MNGILSLIISVVFLGIAVLLCLFSCILASKSDAFWNEVRKDLDDKNERR